MREKEREEEILERYVRIFKNLDSCKKKFNSVDGPPEVMLLLSLIVLHKNDRVDLRDIKPNSKLREIWLELWNCLESERHDRLYDTFYQLKSFDFCNLDFNDHITPNRPTSWDSLRCMVKKAYFDDDLVNLIDNDQYYERLINSLLIGWDFPKREKDKLKVKIDLIEIGSLEKENRLVKLDDG